MTDTTQSTTNANTIMSDLSPGSDPNAQAASPTTQAPQASRPPVRGAKPTLAYLKKLGLKIRDFAYESTLPPVRAYRIQSTQVQPAPPRPLTRESTEPDDGSQSQSQGQQLERKPTEPAIASAAPTRELAFANLEDAIAHSEQPNPFPGPINLQLTINTSGLIGASDSPSASDAVNTDTVSGLHHDSSQDPTSDSYPYSQSGTSQLIQLSQQNEGSTSSPQTNTISPSSPLTPLPSSPVSPRLHTQYSTLSHRTNSTQELRSPTIPRVLQPRYALRKRPAAASSTISSPKPSKRARIIAPSESPLKSRPQSTSHSKRKAKDNSGPSSRTLLKRASNDGKGKRKRT